MKPATGVAGAFVVPGEPVGDSEPDGGSEPVGGGEPVVGAALGSVMYTSHGWPSPPSGLRTNISQRPPASSGTSTVARSAVELTKCTLRATGGAALSCWPFGRANRIVGVDWKFSPSIYGRQVVSTST